MPQWLAADVSERRLIRPTFFFTPEAASRARSAGESSDGISASSTNRPGNSLEEVVGREPSK